MRRLHALAVFLCLAILGGCSFQSDMLLPDRSAAGDPIAGLPTDRAFTLESFDRQNKAFHVIGTMTPQSTGSGKMRYLFALNEDADRLFVQAQKLSDGNYLLRYVETDSKGEANGSSALVFLSVADGLFYALTGPGDQKLFDKVYGTGPRPDVNDGEVKFTSDAQARQLSEFFATHRVEFLIDQDYIRLRLAK
jgi:hypothetical protein